MTPQQTIANGLVGTIASFGACFASITIYDVNSWLTTVSLIIGILVGSFTLCRILRSKPKE